VPFAPSRKRARTRGQTIVEFALTLPVLILLLLFAIDFGRVFLGWISLNNAARVGANYAAMHPHDWDSGSGPAEYDTLMADNLGAINCSPTPDPAADPAFGPTKEPGELVRVDLGCTFTVLTPIISNVLSGTISISSSASFPISSGCLAACPTGPPAPPPGPPADNCRRAPDVRDMSVAGARALWVSAGFLASEFVPVSGPDDTRTVDDYTVSQSANPDGCAPPEYMFNAQMTVTLVPLVTPKPTPTCLYVPDLRGMTVADGPRSGDAAGRRSRRLHGAGHVDHRLPWPGPPSASPCAVSGPELREYLDLERHHDLDGGGLRRGQPQLQAQERELHGEVTDPRGRNVCGV